MESKNKIVIARYIRLTRQQVTSDGKKQNLTWSSRNGMPRCTIYLDNDNVLLPDRSIDYSKVLIARFTPEELLTYLYKVKRIIAKGEQGYLEVDCLYPNIVDGKTVGNEKIVSTIMRIGIDANGLCYIYVKEPNKSEVKFNFEVHKDSKNVWHVYREQNGDLDLKAVGRVRFISYLSILEDLVTDEIKKSVTTVEVEGKDKKQSYNSQNYTSTSTNTKPVVEVVESDPLVDL